MDDSLLATPANKLGGLIEGRMLSLVEQADATLSRISECNGVLATFVTVTGDEARSGARAVEERPVRRERLGPLDGIPLSLKDLEVTVGIRSTFGSRFTADLLADADSVVAGRMRRSGGTLLGKTNTPQVGYKDACDKLVAAMTANPWDVTRTPGSSSGGAVAAVASGLGPVAQGFGGPRSIRTLTSLCGVAALEAVLDLRLPLVPLASGPAREVSA